MPESSGYSSLIPINILSGFLGSGKTTLLKRILASPQLNETAVLINEFGEVGLDHQLVQAVTESTLLLDNGCLCCAIRGDLKDAIRQLFSQRERGDIPFFRRIVIESSGLADPAPIAYTLLVEPVIQHHFRLGNIITVVDAVNGNQQLQSFPESMKQVALADRLIISKTDLCQPSQIEDLQMQLQRINVSAPILTTDQDLDIPSLIVEDGYDDDGKTRAREAQRWLDNAADKQVPHPHHEHTEGVYSFYLRFDQPLDWTAFGIWMTMLLNRYGNDILRIKGLLNFTGLDTPVLINGVQHIVHPPAHLDNWPDQDQRSRIIFIVKGIEQAIIERSLNAFNNLANPPGFSQNQTSLSASGIHS